MLAIALRESLMESVNYGESVCEQNHLLFSVGSPLSILSMSGTDHFSRIHFVDYWPISTDESRSGSEVKLQLLVMCKNGAMYTATIERGFDTRMLQLTERLHMSFSYILVCI